MEKTHEAASTALGRLHHAVFGRFNASFEWLSNRYGTITGRLVRKTTVMLIVYAGLIAATAFRMSRMPTGLIPDQDIGYQAIIALLPPGSSLERTDQVVREVNDIALKTRGIDHTSPVTGDDVTTTTIAPNVGTVFTGLPSLYGEHIKGVNAASMLVTLRKRLATVKDAIIIVVNPPPVQGLGAAGGFKLMLEDRAGLGPQALAQAASALVAAANKDKMFGGVFTLYNAGSPSVYADIDRLKAEKVGLTPTDVFNTIELYLGSQYVNDFNDLNRAYQVRVQGDQAFREAPEDLGRLKARNAAGDMVPIGTVATFKYQTMPYRIPRYNLYPAADVMGAAAPDVSSGQAMDRMEPLANQVLPNGVSFDWTDLAHQQKEQTLSPLAIVLIVPMYLLAAAIGLNIRGMPIDILAQIGFVVLVGLAAKNAILIVEFARQRQDEDGVGPEDVATHAAHVRLRPILMTSFAFIGGVAPLAIASGAGSEMRQSLGTTVFFGILGVTFLDWRLRPRFTRSFASWVSGTRLHYLSGSAAAEIRNEAICIEVLKNYYCRPDRECGACWLRGRPRLRRAEDNHGAFP